MVPTKIERSSWIDRELPIRVYWIDPDKKHKAVRLTYRHGLERVLGRPDDRLGGCARARRAELRPQDRRPARTSCTTTARGSTWSSCKTDGASYWVVNTLLDRLSNETMIAIAKGLRPLATLEADVAVRPRLSSRRDERERQRIAVFGAGYVGLVTGACFAELGHRVTVRDVLPERIEALRRGEVPIYEPGLDELLARNARAPRASRTEVAEAIEGADFVYVAVGTPPTYSGDADLSAVWTVIDELPAVERRIVVAMKSTVPVGTGEKVRHRLDARGLASRRLRLEPGVHRRGHGRQGLHGARPDRDRRVRRGGRRRDRRAPRRDRRADRPLRTSPRPR